MQLATLNFMSNPVQETIDQGCSELRPVQLEGVVRRIKSLTRNPDAKILVFSSWIDVLEVLSYALRENDIPFAFARSAKHLGPALQQFKSSNAVLQTLLLPVQQGGKGLNITGKMPKGTAW